MVSSEEEHQTDNLAVTGSTPVPHRLTTDSPNGSQDLFNLSPKGGERLLDWPRPWFAVVLAAVEHTLQKVDSAVAFIWQRCVNGLAEES